MTATMNRPPAVETIDPDVVRWLAAPKQTCVYCGARIAVVGPGHVDVTLSGECGNGTPFWHTSFEDASR